MSTGNSVDWLQRTMNGMVRCHGVDALMDLAYDAIRDGLGYDRVGLSSVDPARHALVEHIGTDAQGRKFRPHNRYASLEEGTYYARLLADPRLEVDGPGFVYLADASHELPPEVRYRLDGQPGQTLRVVVRTAERIVGLLSVDNLISGRPITPADAPPLVAFSYALATALDNVRLLEERAHRIHDLDADLRQRVEQLTWLQDAAAQLARPHSLDDVLDTIYRCLREGRIYDRVGICLVDQDDHGRRIAREYRGTDEQGKPTGGLPDQFALDDAELLLHSPDLHHLAQGHAYYYCPDRWAITPPEYRYQLEGEMREQLVVALRLDDRLTGYFSVDNLLSKRPITESDATPLIAFAAQAALAINRARLWVAHEEQGHGLARRVAELEWLREISRRVNAAQSLDEVLDVVYDGIRAGLGYDRVGIQVIDHDRNICEEVRGTDAHGRKTCPVGHSYTLDKDSPVWQTRDMVALLEGAEFYYTPDIYAETPAPLRHMLDGQPKDNLVVPLRTGALLTGVISVDNYVSGRAIEPSDAGPLLALANQVATAVENARLRDRERAERARLEVLLESARALNSTLNQDEILHELAVRLVAVLGATHAVFSHADVASRTVRALAQHSTAGTAPLYMTAEIMNLAEYPIVEQILCSRTLFHGSVDDPNCPASEREFLRAHHLHAELLVPVVVRGDASNMLEVYWQQPIAISADTVTLCTTIAEQSAVALTNARLYADAAERAERDALTGLLNHRTLLERIDHAIALGHTCTLLLLDVDNFKLFNDTFGHITGDGVLIQVAETLHEVCRGDDLAGRYGGDEFAVLLRHVTPEEAQTVIRRLSLAVRARPHVTSDGAIIPLSVSVGSACFPADGRSRQELIAVADHAMYAAKRGAGVEGSAAQEAEQWTDLRVRDASDLLGDSPFGVLDGLVNAVDAKDRYTRLHSDDVTQLALVLAEALGLPAEQRRVLALAGPLHDVGKIAVPDRILRKPGALSADEYAVIMRHVTYGVAIIRGVLDDGEVIDAIAYHHERWDGRGYPHGLAGPDTPLLGRIMQVADAASAMGLDRPYRKGLPWSEVIDALRAGAGAQFDPTLVEPFIAAINRAQSRVAS